MNYLAHGRLFLDEPYFLAGTAVPDWLNVSDRGTRVRSKHAQCFVDDADPCMAALARGVAQHHADDGWFHQTAAFAELSWLLTVRVRDLAAADDGLRPSFLGHILVEILLDATLSEADPRLFDAYYAALAHADAAVVEAAVNRMAPRPAERLAQFVGLFGQVRFLYDYSDDVKLCYRLNQVLKRVGLASLPAGFDTLLPDARRLVAERMGELLGGEARVREGRVAGHEDATDPVAAAGGPPWIQENQA